jgi:hypothetical protein
MSVVHSIVLALGIARILGGFADVARDWSQLGTKWFFLGWLVLLLAGHMGWWFGLWTRFRGMTEIDLAAFFVWFMIPASFYVASRLLIPEFPEDSPPDLDSRFARVRVPFFACLALAVSPVLPSLSAAAHPRWLLAAFGALALSGVFIQSRFWHVTLLGLMLATYTAFLALARTSIGG